MARRRFALLAPALLVMACNDSTEPPRGGTYTARLQSPHGAEGAASIRLMGTGITSVASATGTLFAGEPAAGAGQSIVVVQEPAGTIEFTVTVAAGHDAPTAQVVVVVDGADQPRASLAGYSVAFSRGGGQ